MNFDARDQRLLEQIAEHYRAILELVGEDPNRQGLLKTPMRAAKALLENTRGYREDPAPIISSAIFDHPGSQMIIVRDIEFYSQCEHHLLPFFGTFSIGYVPRGGIVGLSKLARIVDTYSRRFQVQERLTQEVCDLLTAELPSSGVIVMCSAQHMCMQMRGVEKQGSSTVTIQYSGDFNSPELREQFFTLLNNSHRD